LSEEKRVGTENYVRGYEYDEQALVTKVSQIGTTTFQQTYRYDGMQLRSIEQVGSESCEFAYRYNPNGQLTRQTKTNSSDSSERWARSFAYDVNGRLATETFTEAEQEVPTVIDYRYDCD